MAFETGNATGWLDLISRLKTFLEGAGWTTDFYGAYGGTGQWLATHRDSLFVNIVALINQIPPGYSAVQNGLVCQGADGYNFANGPYGQAPTPVNTGGHPYGNNFAVGILAPDGPLPNYWFFASTVAPIAVHVVVETSAGQFQRMSFGQLVKQSPWTGSGLFTAGKAASGGGSTALYPFTALGVSTTMMIRAEVDGQGDWLLANNYSDYLKPYDLWSFDLYNQAFRNASPSAFNQQTVLMPVQIFVARDGFVSQRSPLGYLPDIFFANIRYLTPGSEYAVGGVSYRVFPFASKTADNSADGETTSGWYGYAVRVRA